MFVLPGGEHEQIIAQYGKEDLFLLRRKGFVRLAIKHSFKIVPIYCFGESRTYFTFSLFLSFRKWMVDTLRVGVPLVWGQWGLLPHKVKLTFVVGQPVDPREERFEGMEGEELVDAVHAEYVRELEGVFERNKERCGMKESKLNIM